MSYTFTKTTVTEFTITSIKRNFMSYKTFAVARKDITACSHCETPFQPDDETNLAFVAKGLNLLLCNGCAEIALANGAEETTFS